jgi:hypothetical protein
MAGEKDERANWKHWIVPEYHPAEADLLKREEVITKVRDLYVRRPDGREVDERVMRYWEKLGVIPAGSTPTRGYKYKLYPWWIVDLLYQVCCYQARDIDLDRLPALMREEAQRLARDPYPRQKQNQPSSQDKPDYWISLFDPGYRERLREPTQPPFPRPPDVIYDRTVERLIALLNTIAPGNGLAGMPIEPPTRVRVEFIGDQGQRVRAYDVALDDPGATDDFIAQDKQASTADRIATWRHGYYKTADKE